MIFKEIDNIRNVGSFATITEDQDSRITAMVYA